MPRTRSGEALFPPNQPLSAMVATGSLSGAPWWSEANLAPILPGRQPNPAILPCACPGEPVGASLQISLRWRIRCKLGAWSSGSEIYGLSDACGEDHHGLCKGDGEPY